jgi:signal transduction histidine kinase
LRVPAAVAGAVVALTAAVELAAWLAHERTLLQVRPGQVPMQFNTALLLLLLGTALLLLPTRWYRAAALPAGFVAGWGALTLGEYLLRRSFGIDTLLFRPWIVVGVDAPGRMARNTALCFAVLGAAVLVLVLTRRRAPLLVGLAASLVAALALVAIFGYASGVSTAYTWRTSTAMAPVTAGCLLALAVGYVATAWVLSPEPGAPRWLPVPVGVCALATTLFLWEALVGLGTHDRRTLSVDRAAGIVLAIGLVLSALLAVATAAGQAALRRRRVAEGLTRELETEGVRRAAVQDALLRRTQRDGLLREAYAAVSATGDLDVAFARFADAAATALTFDRATLTLVEDGVAVAVAVAGTALPRAGVGTRTPVTDALLDEIIAGRRPYLVRDVTGRFGESFAARAGVRSMVSVPIVIGGEVHALLGFAARHADAFDDEHLALAEELGSVVGGALYTLARLVHEQDTSARLRELDTLKNEFVGVVAHDLRSPMTVIAGYVDTVLNRWDDIPDPMKRELLGVASKNTKRLSVLVEDVLQVARIESGEFPYDIKPFDLGALVRRTAEEMGSARPAKPVVATVPDGLPVALGDEDRQWRVLTNLLSNAQKFSPDGVPAEVCVHPLPDCLEVTVTDHGPGIPAEDLPRLFGKFARLAPPKTGESGTGLGLYICRALVEAQGGAIDVRSEVGVGTTVRYTVPEDARGKAGS